MRKGRDGGKTGKKKREKKREKKEEKKGKKTDDYSGHYVIASSRPPERRPLERRPLVPICSSVCHHYLQGTKKCKEYSVYSVVLFSMQNLTKSKAIS